MMTARLPRKKSTVTANTDHKNDVIKYQIMQVRTKTETSKLVLYSETESRGVWAVIVLLIQ